MAKDRIAIDQLAAYYQGQASGFKKKNPNITPPLAKLELEALKNLVQWQADKNVGPRWADYHRSVFNSEATRPLRERSEALGKLQTRAEQALQQLNQARTEQAARLLAQQVAQQAAEQAARLKTAQALARTTYRFGTAAAAPSIAQLGPPAAIFTQATSTALQLSVRAAIVSIAAGIAGTALSPLVVLGAVVGVIALAWPNTVGSGERQLSVALPLADLMPSEKVDLQAVADAGDSITLPYRLMTAGEGDQTKLIVARPDSHTATAQVITAKFDAGLNAYSVTLESPQRTLLWTPSQAPGDELTGSTSLPGEPAESQIYPSPAVTPITPAVQTLPSADAAGIEQIVIIFPSDSFHIQQRRAGSLSRNVKQ